MKLKEKQGIAHITISLFLFVFLFVAKAQPPIAKKINAALRLHQKEDTTKVNLLNKLAHSYIYFIPDSGKIIIEKSLQLSEKLNYKKGKAEALVFSSVLLHHEGKSEKGIKLSEESLKISTEIDYQTGIADALKNLGNIYNEIGQFDTSL